MNAIKAKRTEFKKYAPNKVFNLSNLFVMVFAD